MSAEENEAVVRRYIEEVWNRHDLDAIDELVSPDYLNHAAGTDEYRYGGARHSVSWLLSVFPDHHFDIEDAVANGDTVAVRGTMVGTHEGELMGIAPTDERCAAQQSHWFRVADGNLDVQRVLVRERLWVVEAVIEYGGGHVLNVVFILELRDGKLWRDKWYFAEPFEAPEWRSQWVERIEA